MKPAFEQKCLYVPVRVYACVCTRVHPCICVRAYVCLIRACVCVYVRVCVCVWYVKDRPDTQAHVHQPEFLY